MNKQKMQQEMPVQNLTCKSGLTPNIDFFVSQGVKKTSFIQDRFIPKRTGIHSEFIFQAGDNSNDYDVSLYKLYKRHVLGLSNRNFFSFGEHSLPQKKLDDIIREKQPIRPIPKLPYKILDAPALKDDFYLNLIDWGSNNLLAVGLASSVYLWSAQTSKVTKLCDLNENGGGSFFQSVNSVTWAPENSLLAIGTNGGMLQIWDSNKQKKIRDCKSHSMRIGTLNWNNTILSSGSRDMTIINRDIRQHMDQVSVFAAHKQEICGLKWSFDQHQLASGGNDNNLFIWTLKSTNPIYKFNKHLAAVKALAWSPHQHSLLASGGGTVDRTIRFWNTLQGRQLNCYETQSQVCNLQFSKNVNELVSTHGYSLNQIIVWKYPEMYKTATLLGHTYRVLFLAMSPDGRNIVTGAGDQTLRFWSVFPATANDLLPERESLLDSKSYVLK